jgi:hypothetical protein
VLAQKYIRRQLDIQHIGEKIAVLEHRKRQIAKFHKTWYDQ